MATNQSDFLIGRDQAQRDQMPFRPVVGIARYQGMVPADVGLFPGFDTKRYYAPQFIGSYTAESANVDALSHAPFQPSRLTANLQGILARAYAVLRWVGLLCLEVFLIPVSGSKPMKNSILYPMAQKLASRWTRK